MKPCSITPLLMLAGFFLSAANTCPAQAQPQTQRHTEWPRSVGTAGGKVIVFYQPRFLSYQEDTVRFRSVISIKTMGDPDPVFAVAWTTATVIKDTTYHDLVLQSVRVDRLRMPDDTDRDHRDFIKTAIALYYPQVVRRMPVSEVQASLALEKQEEALSADSGAPAPKIYFARVPTALVEIDGEPKFVMNERWGLEVVANSHNLIVQAPNGKYYLFGGMAWYVAPAATGPYTPFHGILPFPMWQVTSDLMTAANKTRLEVDDSEIPLYKIVVSKEPAALIQSGGEPKFEPVLGTSLRRVINSHDDIFMDWNTDRYYTMVGSQWYQSLSLSDSTAWRPVDMAQLPAELVRTTEKKTVTTAMADEQVPQTSRVDRGMTTTVVYEGAPEFRPIPGTGLEYATNTCSIVFRYNGGYYALDNGVWFVADSPLGIWRVSDVRPAELELIPRRYRVYRAKFVYIYQRGPDFVYEGYLPGYEDDPVDGCALTAAYDYDWMDTAWGYDLDFLFGWGWGRFQGYFRFDRENRTYGRMVHGGKHPGWHEKGIGPLAKIHYGAGASAGVLRGGKPGGLSRSVPVAGVWHGGNSGGGGGVSRGGISGGGVSHGGGSISHSGGGSHH